MDPAANLPFRIARTGNLSGTQVFASRDIEAGELISVEPPIAVLPLALPSLSPSPFDAIFERLDPDVRRTIEGSADRTLRKRRTLAEHIIRTRGICIELRGENGRVVGHTGIFLIASQVKHSCSPNAAYVWDKDTFTLTLRAGRHIAVGEEITIAYTPLMRPRVARQLILRSSYGFNCTCSACTLPVAESVRSDQARIELAKWWEHSVSFEYWLADDEQPRDALILAHVRALAVLDSEGLFAPRAKHLEVVARCYGALGMRDAFVKQATEAADAWRVESALGLTGSREKAEQRRRRCGRWTRDPEAAVFWAKRA
ncbi:SET domain-containing protein [Peniophora sp. CONT]|nr:SET domain-containing protein [Peniophora sp. CONT]